MVFCLVAPAAFSDFFWLCGLLGDFSNWRNDVGVTVRYLEHLMACWAGEALLVGVVREFENRSTRGAGICVPAAFFGGFRHPGSMLDGASDCKPRRCVAGKYPGLEQSGDTSDKGCR